MGTNYYLHLDPCEHCGRPSHVIHIGKSAHGWRFCFREYDDDEDFVEDGKPIKSLERWRELISRGDIFDEYDRQCPRDDFWRLIYDKGDLKSSHRPAGPADFCHREFS
jgi:hypothetical protein